jgi:hypothetical protein
MSPRRRETVEQREHRLDREVSAATWRYEQARAGKGYVFKIPEKAREA